MSFQFIMRLVITCAILLLCAKAQDNNLEPIINDLSVLARLANGISVQAKITNDPGSTIAVAAELLAVSGSFTKLTLLDIGSVPQNIESFRESLQKAQPFKVKDLDQLTNSVEVLQNMKKDLPRINKGMSWDHADLTAALAKTAGLDPSLNILDAEPFTKVIPALKFSLSKVMAVKGLYTEGADHLKALKEEIPKVIFRMKSLKEYQKHVSELLDLKGKSAGMGDVMVLSETAQKYVDNFGVLNDLKKELDEVKKGVNNLSPIAKEHGKMAEIGKKMDEVKAVVEGMQQKNTNKQLTVGLPKGVEDLNRIADDLKSKWLKEAIGNGKDIGKLAEQLQPLTPFSQKVTQLGKDWKKLDDPNTLSTITPLSKMLAGAADNGKIPSNEQLLLTSIESVQSCLVNLQPATANTNLAKFKETHEKLVRIDQLATSLADVLPKLAVLKEVNQDSYDTCNRIKLLVQPHNITSPKADETDYIHGNISEIAGLDVLISQFETIEKEIVKFKDFMGLVQDTYDWNTIKTTQKSLDGTELLTALACLDGKKFDSDGIDKMLKFGTDIEQIKQKSSQLESIKKYVEQVDVVKKDLDLVMKKGVRRRKSVGMLDWKDGEQISRNLGKGVEVLRQLEAVWKEQKRVEAVGKSGQSVDQLLQGTPLVSAFWTADNKKALLDLVEAVNSLNKEAVNFRSNDLLAMGGLFEEASKIRGSPVKSELLAPVAASMATSSDPHVKSLSDDFKHVSDLQLDYANGYTSLKAAKMTLDPLRTFLHGILGIATPSAGKKTPNQSAGRVISVTTPNPLSPFILLAVVIGLVLVLLCVGAFCIWYFLKKNDELFWHRLFMNKEKYDKLLVLNSRYLAFQEPKFKPLANSSAKNLLEAVEANDVAAATNFIMQGAWVNAYKDTDSCLHIAIKQVNLEMVELLLRNGADTALLNGDYKTPEKSIADVTAKWKEVIKISKQTESQKEAADMFASTVKPKNGEALKASDFKVIREKEEKEAPEKMKTLEQITALFGSLKDEKFRRHVPPLLPVQEFKIFVSPNCQNPKFAKKFTTTTQLEFATHVVVKTDKDGVFEPDDNYVDNIMMMFDRAMIMKESWMEACLQKKSAARNDFKFQVEKVRYKGQIYETMKTWHEKMHMKDIPYLKNVFCYFIGLTDWKISTFMERLGAELYKECPVENLADVHPYHLSKHEPIWIVFPTSDMTTDKRVNDYRKMSLEDLFVMLLKRELVHEPPAKEPEEKEPEAKTEE